MKTITLRQASFMNALVFFVLVASFGYLLYRVETLKIDSYLNLMIKDMQDDVIYSITQRIQSEGIGYVSTYIDRKAAIHKIIKAICVAKNGKVVASTNREHIGLSIDSAKHSSSDSATSIWGESFDIHKDIIIFEGGQYVDYRVVIHLNKEYIENIYSETFYNILGYVSILGSVFLLLQWFIFFRFIQTPIDKITKSIAQKRFNNTFLINEFNTLNKEYSNAYTEISSYSKHLQKLVEIESEKRRKSEILLLQQHKSIALTELLTNIAHHWRQPLNAIALIVDNIKDLGEDLEEPQKTIFSDNIALCYEEIGFLTNTIDNFTKFFKGDHAKTRIDIGKLLEDLLILYKKQLEAEAIRYELIKCNEPVATYDYAGDIKNIFVNLLMNAKEAIWREQARGVSRDWKIVIELIKPTEDRFEVTISDNGEGIGDEVASRIFEPYFTTKFKSRGVGLGLYMSKMIAEQLGGQLVFKKSKEKLTTFLFSAPIKLYERNIKDELALESWE